MNTYRVKVRSVETFEIDAETEEQAEADYFDGHLVYTGEAEVVSVTMIDRAESGNRWVADRAAGGIG